MAGIFIADAFTCPGCGLQGVTKPKTTDTLIQCNHNQCDTTFIVRASRNARGGPKTGQLPTPKSSKRAGAAGSASKASGPMSDARASVGESTVTDFESLKEVQGGGSPSTMARKKKSSPAPAAAPSSLASGLAGLAANLGL